MSNQVEVRTVAYYDAHADEYANGTREIDLTPQRARFLSQVPFRGQILDVGCGSGRDLKFFAGQGYSVTGIDASIALVVRAREYSGVACQVMSFNEIAWKEEFDGFLGNNYQFANHRVRNRPNHLAWPSLANKNVVLCQSCWLTVLLVRRALPRVGRSLLRQSASRLPGHRW